MLKNVLIRVSGWEKINVVNRTPLVENIIIKNETNLEIDLKTESYGGSLDNIVEYKHIGYLGF